MIKPTTWQVSKLIAHRGASVIAPENTIAALTKAVDFGATWVEADVRLTLDNEAVIFHDTKLDRCTNGRGLVNKTPYSIMSTLDAGSWFSPQYAGEKIPTLQEWLEVAAQLGCGIILDLKCSWHEAKKLSDYVSVLLARHWNSRGLPRPIISSDSVSCLRAMHAQQLDWELAYILPREQGPWEKTVDKLECISVHIDHQSISERWLQQIKARGLRIAAYTVNDPLRAQQLFDWGVDSIFSDDPRLLAAADPHKTEHSSDAH
jgi:glycerophosphoryl diester phosphodiesterase